MPQRLQCPRHRVGPLQRWAAKAAGGRERGIAMAHAISGTPSRGRDLVLGFLAGALAVVTFHQGMVFLLSSVGLIQSRVYALQCIFHGCLPPSPWEGSDHGHFV